ncbi:hypothetical protein [Amycolatopsis australiensis]|uniref:Sporulation and spore germination n=1 Tax=Amycolatopsis australiensis TaxID=546364 RepID=A0A1K1RY49_9PSEU|nr:hypothetical protein [Amycolatopsis australiensis]SFW76993.1 hypothetical protein SAMN04489730_4228 [Amycolatopsis australiensis]
MKRLLVLAVLLLVSACGIQPTPVVAAGPAPTLRNPAPGGRGADVILYFVLDGRLAPVTRPTGSSAGVNTALALLLGGPSYAEAADGYTTMLPPGGGQVALAPGSPAEITFSFPLRDLNALAVNQLVCTAFAALAAVGSPVVDGAITLVGTDTKLPGQSCQAI